MQIALFTGCALVGLLQGFIAEGKLAGGRYDLSKGNRNGLPPGSYSSINGSTPWHARVYPPNNNQSEVTPQGLGGGTWSGATQTGSPWQFGDALGLCQDCNTGVMWFIGKLEKMILSLPLAIIRGAIRIPAKIVEVAVVVGSKLMGVCSKALRVLGSFFGTLFSIPARMLSKVVQLSMAFLRRLVGWGENCEGQEYCQEPLPVIKGIGPCAGQWPCTRTVACNSSTCYNASRALLSDSESDLDEKVTKP